MFVCEVFDRHIYERVQKVTREKQDIENEHSTVGGHFFVHVWLHLIARVVKKEREWVRISLPIYGIKVHPPRNIFFFLEESQGGQSTVYTNVPINKSL